MLPIKAEPLAELFGGAVGAIRSPEGRQLERSLPGFCILSGVSTLCCRSGRNSFLKIPFPKGSRIDTGGEEDHKFVRNKMAVSYLARGTCSDSYEGDVICGPRSLTACESPLKRTTAHAPRRATFMYEVGPCAGWRRCRDGPGHGT